MNQHADINTIAAIANDLAADAPTVENMLNLLRQGHPRSSMGLTTATSSPKHDTDTDNEHGTTHYPDPTGDTALTPDHAAHIEQRWRNLRDRALKDLQALDRIRLANTPPRINPNDIEDPTNLCRNCMTHGHAHSERDGRNAHCTWCRRRKEATGHLPPRHVLDLHHAGRNIDADKAMATYAQTAKKKRK